MVLQLSNGSIYEATGILSKLGSALIVYLITQLVDNL